jgi:hypothetical protein
MSTLGMRGKQAVFVLLTAVRVLTAPCFASELAGSVVDPMVSCYIPEVNGGVSLNGGNTNIDGPPYIF